MAELVFEDLSFEKEKDRTDLQKLEPSFFNDTISYIKEKKKILEAKTDSPFANEEIKKTERQLENIYKIIKELYGRREKKIITMAMDRSRTQSNLIDTSVLLKEEKVFFDTLTALLDTYREQILLAVLNERIPFLQGFEYKKQKEEVKLVVKSTKLVRFTGHVPKFVGTELEEYGPFEEEDIANLPIEIADVLINKSKAEEMKEE
ncbi:MAG TPA: hypothetical protein VJI97_02010 [Candidatus Nanoarchaeia archaeon]|nr:hypothetical protein [Candidatus Nanoarchaeia archaeon]